MATREAERAKRTALSQALFGQLSAEFGVLEKWLAYSTAQLEARRAAPPGCQRLETSPGMGPLTATALVAAVSETNAFQHGRQFAAWLGRVPRPPATGGKARWWGISNRGAVYRRQLLVQGARATLRWGGLQADRRRQWLRGLLARRGKQKTAGGPRQEKRADGLGAPHDRASVRAEQQRPKRI